MNPINGLYRKLRYPEGYRTTDIPQGILITHMMPPPSQPQNEIYVNGKNVVSEYEQKLLEDKLKKEYLKQMKIREAAQAEKSKTDEKTKPQQPKSQQQAQVAAEVRQAEEADAAAQASINGEQQKESNIPVQGNPNAPPQYPGTNIQPRAQKLSKVSQLQQATQENKDIVIAEAEGWRKYFSQTVQITKHDIAEAKKAELERAFAQKVLTWEEDERKQINEKRLYNIIAAEIKQRTGLELTPDEFHELLNNPEEKIQELTTVISGYQIPVPSVGGRDDQTKLTINPVKQEVEDEKPFKLEPQTTFNDVPEQSTVSLELKLNSRSQTPNYKQSLISALDEAEKVLRKQKDSGALKAALEALQYMRNAGNAGLTIKQSFYYALYERIKKDLTITPPAKQLAYKINALLQDSIANATMNGVTELTHRELIVNE